MSHLQRHTEATAGADESYGDSAPGGGEGGADVGIDAAEDGEATELRSNWHVILIAALMDFGQSAAFRSSGFIYVALMDHFQVDHGTASWPVSVLGTIVDAGGILAGPLCQWIGAAVTLKAGALVTAVGVMASVLAPNIAWMTVTLGIIHGAGAGTVSMMLQVFLSMRFVKYRGTAHGIMFMGSILSSLVIPQVLFFLEKSYGFDGCLLIFGALLLHLVPISFLLRSDSSTATAPQYDPRQEVLAEKRDVNLNIKDIVQSEHRSRTSSSCTERKLGVLESATQVLRLPMFYVILVTWTVMCYNEDIFLTTIVDFAVDKGVAKHLAVPLLSYLSITDAIGRIGLPLLADRNVIRRSTLVGCNAALTAASIAILPEANSYALLVVATLLAACFNGCGMTMHGVLMADYIGMDNLPVGYGVAGILVVPLLLIKPLLIGYFRDTLGSYNNLYRMLGGMQVVLFLLWLFISYREWRKRPSPPASPNEEAKTPNRKDICNVSYIKDCHHSSLTPCFCPGEEKCHFSKTFKESRNSGLPWIVNGPSKCLSYLDAANVGCQRTAKKCYSLESTRRKPVGAQRVSNYGSVTDFNSEQKMLGSL